jgi:hypothetical protein
MLRAIVHPPIEAASGASQTRRSPRLPAHHLVGFASRVGGWVDPRENLGRTLDVSSGGVGFETPRSLRHGEPLYLRIAVGNRIVDATATVVHVRSLDGVLWAAGARFDHLPEEGRVTLLRPA